MTNMSFDLNKVTLIWRCTAEISTKIIESNKLSITNFVLITNDSHKTETWYKNEAEYHKCIAFGINSEVLAKYLTKGKQLYLEGKLRTKKREANDWTARYTTEILVNNFIFLDHKWEEDPMSDNI